MSELKFCKDCKHVGVHGTVCHRNLKEKHIGIDLVTGNKVYKEYFPEYTRTERESILPWKCGKKGRYFEPKEKE